MTAVTQGGRGRPLRGGDVCAECARCGEQGVCSPQTEGRSEALTGIGGQCGWGDISDTGGEGLPSCRATEPEHRGTWPGERTALREESLSS